MVRLTDRPDMTLDVYRGRKTTTQQQINYSKSAAMGFFSKGLKNKFETAVVNEPSDFEPLKVYCT